METTSVSSKGQVTIPKHLRQQLGIRAGSRIGFERADNRLLLRVVDTPREVPTSGFGLLKSKRGSVPADFDPATLLAEKSEPQ